MKKFLVNATFCLIVFFGYKNCFAQDLNRTRIIEITTQVQNSPAALIFSWPAINTGRQVSIFRKSKDDLDWDLNKPIATLPGNATTFTDNTVVEGIGYEYFFRGFGENGNPYTYIYGGVNLTQTDNRGKLILLVDDSFTISLSAELKRLEEDIEGDGWQVIRHNVNRNATVPSVRALIKADYVSDPENVKAVFLFGHIPVPYSGDIAWDSHPDHNGAWPADGYYGDMVGVWTDRTVNTTQASRPQNHNIIGDGKFDQNYLPALTTLQVGRVDLSNMPNFRNTEEELLKRYLKKDHDFRHKIFTAQQQAVIDNNFGLDGFDSSFYASCGWRSFVAMFIPSALKAADYFRSTLPANSSYLWAYGAGGGNYTSAQGVGSTSDFSFHAPKAVFHMLFGSYFGDWDSENNFLRAPLASRGWGLSSCWAGRPYWINHHTALGETLGYSAWITMRNTCYQSDGPNFNQASIALMGDPTLRIHPVAPPTNLLVVNKQLTWVASAEPVKGYCVYLKNTTSGVYNLLATTTSTTTTYTHINASPNINYYMVRALKLETSNSGSYNNLSQGAFGFTDNVLPLQITKHTAKLNNNTVVNYWEAKNQIDVNFINLQRSTNGFDFVTLAKITPNKTGIYSFTDTQLPTTNNTIYYRLQIVDNNATEQLGDVVAVNVKLNSIAEVTIYPNPVIANQINLKLSGLPKGTYKVMVINSMGLNVKEFNFYYDGKTLIKNLGLNIDAGVYMLNIATENYNETRKILVD